MQIEIKLKEINQAATEVFLLYWLSDIGDIVNFDEPIIVLCNEKEIFSIFSPAAGIIQEIFFRSGEKIVIEKTLGIIETDVEAFNP